MKKALLASLVVSTLFFFSTGFAAPKINIKSLVKTFVSETQGLRPVVVRTALVAYTNALKDGITDNKQIVTVIDYSMPSSKKRMWVLDLRNKEVLFHTLVAHGKNNGINTPVRFSNRPGSLESSVGLYLTKGTYDGHDGYSLILSGLDKGFNNNAEARHIIMHGAWYVGQNIINAYGRIGRSWGCAAINKRMVKPVINTIKDGTLLLAYYPDKAWLDHSIYLA